MIFSIQSRKDKFVEKIYNQAMKELDDFFEIGWVKNKPKVFIVGDRMTIDELWGRKTNDWVVGWSNNGNIYVLDRAGYNKKSSNKYSEKEYACLIKHELVHVFTQVFLKIFNKPVSPNWIWEGVATYLSGQNEILKEPKELKHFLQAYLQDLNNTNIYLESGFAVEFLIKKYGKEKFLELLKSLIEIDSEVFFAKKFKKIYGFELNYKNFNL